MVAQACLQLMSEKEISGCLSVLLKSNKPKRELIEQLPSSNNKRIDGVLFLTSIEYLLCTRQGFLILEFHKSLIRILFLICRLSEEFRSY